MNNINQLNKDAILLIKSSKQKQAIPLLFQAEQMLEFAANSGYSIDRNLIVVILYNTASAYQGLWSLEQTQQYLDAAIYNLEQIIKIEEYNILNHKIGDFGRSLSVLVQKQTYLSKFYLQQCAILSQLGMQSSLIQYFLRHKSSMELAQKTIYILSNLFQASLEFVQEALSHTNPNVSSISATNTSSTSSDKNNVNINFLLFSSNQTFFWKKTEVQFSKVVLDQAEILLKDIQKITLTQSETLSNLLNKSKKQIYFWRTNPQNNEKQLRQELQIKQKEEDNRSVLGIQNGMNWIQTFNIGTIMHMQPILYDEFCLCGGMVYELQKKLLLEKVIYMSISHFTIATELRFIQMEINQKSIPDKQSELHHLKAIEIACKHIPCSTPYINHLIQSYHKHYKQNLDTIPEEQEDIDKKYQKKLNSLIKGDSTIKGDLKKQSSSTTLTQWKQQIEKKKEHKNSFDPSQLEQKINAMIQSSKLLGGKIHSRQKVSEVKKSQFQLNIGSLSRNSSKDEILTSRPGSDIKKNQKQKNGNQSDRCHYYGKQC